MMERRGERRRWIVSVFIVLAVLPQLSYGDETCTGKPIAVPIQNVTLNGGATSWGVPVKLGTPPQQFAMRLTTRLNATIVRTHPLDRVMDLCRPFDIPEAEAKCNELYGGLFSRNQSSTWREYGPDDPAVVKAKDKESALERPDLFDAGYGEDRAALGEFELKKLEFGVTSASRGMSSSDRYTRPWYSDIGLAPNATILDTLQADGTISARMFGVDMGWTGREEREGELVLGGYNKKRVKGNLYTQKISTSLEVSGGECPYLVIITSITMQKPGAGYDVKLTNGSSNGDVIRACLDPSVNTLRLPPAIPENFNRENDGVYRRLLPMMAIQPIKSEDYRDGYRVDNENAYNGSIRIQLASGFLAIIPSHLLHQPTYDHLSFDGSLGAAKNASQQIMTMEPLDFRSMTAGQMPLLGLPFMRSVYFMADLEKGGFSLASLSKDTGRELVPSDCSREARDAISKDVASPEDTHSGTSGSGGKEGTSGINGGVIAGAVVAGVVVIAAVAFGVFFTQRRKRRESKIVRPAELPGHNAESELEAKELHSGSNGLSEAGSRAVYEADGNGRVYHEMDSGMVNSKGQA
ncbi:acid protease [Ascobolus immersus RN42]|uniref:Acid protease n=1 Tax=Ascobolus immersus RN42 TaxID=1160509 RepID=A0A3N4I9U9_ASCIM|nr:acid protease [Ascobolus immersus RN42]